MVAANTVQPTSSAFWFAWSAFYRQTGRFPCQRGSVLVLVQHARTTAVAGHPN